MLTFINYKKCSTCKNAEKWLKENNIQFEDRQIVENNPTIEELKNFLILSKQPIKKFFNTSGIIYREMNLKDKVATESEEVLLEILCTNGMLVKRPLLVTEDTVLIGFKPQEWEEYFSKK
ncbi:MAG: arsenate reductase family protein [Fusobacteriaceae bacterium]